MGYYSDVSIVVPRDKKSELDRLLAECGVEPDCAGQSAMHYAVVIYNIKWYYGSTPVTAIQDFVTGLPDYEFARQGEDPDDFERLTSDNNRSYAERVSSLDTQFLTGWEIISYEPDVGQKS